VRRSNRPALTAALLLLLAAPACAGDDSSTSATTTGDTETTASTSTDSTSSSTTTSTSGESTTTSSSSSTSSTSSTSAGTTDATTGDDTTTGGLPPPPASLEEVIDGEVELIAGDHIFTEGPVWDPQQGALLYSDIPADTIFRWKTGEGASEFRKPSGRSNGLIFDQEGRLLACEHQNRRLSRTEGDTVVTVVDNFEGKKLNSPNDLVVRSDGAIFFTDPPYGIQPDQQELPYQGVFRVDPRGTLHLLVDDFERPNGVVLSPDESTLYVADSAKKHLRAFAVDDQGDLSQDQIFLDMDAPGDGVPDGIAVDHLGDLLATGPGGVWVITREGDHLGTIPVPEIAANVAFGGDDGKTLFITARTSVYAIRLKHAGLGWP
jgi:gluconolactonase